MESSQKSRAAFSEMTTQDKLSMARELIDRINKGDLVSRQRLVIDRLSTIRVGKRKILNHLQILKGKEESGEYSNRELVGKLIESYDGLMAQEKEFIALMRDIIKSYHEAIDAVTSELNSLQDSQQIVAEMSVAEDDQEQKKLENSVSTQLDGLVSGFNSLENMVEEMEKASLMDEQFKTCIELHYEQKKKMELMHQIHLKEKASLELTTKELSDHAKRRVVNERSDLDRKQKQLERLRREAERRGFLTEGDTSRQRNDVGTTNKNRSLKRLQQKQPPDTASIKPIIAENERIPSLPSLSIFTSTDNSTGKKKDELRSKISERFASLEAKKQRMRLIRMKLNNLETKKMDNAYDEAVKRVHCLDEMRKKLEDLKTNMEKNETMAVEEEADGNSKTPSVGDAVDGIPGDESVAVAAVLCAENVTSECQPSGEESVGDNEDNNHSSPTTEELIAQVRQAFNLTIKNFSNNSNLCTLPDALSAVHFEGAVFALADRLTEVENTLSTHSDQLTWIGNKKTGLQGPSSSSSASVEIRQENISDVTISEVARIIEVLTQFLNAEFTVDKMEPLDEKVGSRVVEILISESSLLYPLEFDEKMRHNFSTIFGALVSGFYGKKYAEVATELIAQLEECVRSELLFLRLMRSANALTSLGQREDAK